MTVSVDFLKLYQELNLPPSASFEDIKLAYRRRVSELHPDRAEGAGSLRDPERLQQLTTLYGATATFYRRHGRLPGSAIPTRAVPPPPVARRPAAVTVARRRRLRGIHLLFAAIAAGVLWFSMASWEDAPSEDAPAPRAERMRDAPPATPVREPAQPLQLGMSFDDVAAIEGAPITRSNERWDYGASWIEFRQNKVSDWYSSPLQPLKAATKHPQDPATP